jgi:hypothetical protein
MNENACKMGTKKEEDNESRRREAVDGNTLPGRH